MSYILGIHGYWTQWSYSAACTRSCGVGMRNRIRTCIGQDGCIGPSTDRQHCNVHPCPLGTWSVWSHWSPCSQSCNGGQQQSTRYCIGTGNCLGTTVQRRGCNVKPCPVRSAWTGWSAWAGCTVTCGHGLESRRRYCPGVGQQSCPGPNRVQKTCSRRPCLGTWTAWHPWGVCSRTCLGMPFTANVGTGLACSHF